MKFETVLLLHIIRRTMNPYQMWIKFHRDRMSTMFGV